MVNQNIDTRWCGYCGEHHTGDLAEFFAHLSVCEKLLVKFLKKTKPKK